MPSPKPHARFCRFHMAKIPSLELKDQWLEAMLPHVAFDGWTREAADAAAKDAGLSKAEQALAAPGGVLDLINHFFDRAEGALLAGLDAADLSDLGVRAKVALGVKLWLEALEPHREPVRRAAQRAFLPWRTGPAAGRAWSVADAIWTGIGDTSTDYNKYSKRGILAAALPPIVYAWIDGAEGEDLDDVILKHLTRAMKVGQTGGKFFKPLLDVFASR